MANEDQPSRVLQSIYRHATAIRRVVVKVVGVMAVVVVVLILILYIGLWLSLGSDGRLFPE